MKQVYPARGGACILGEAMSEDAVATIRLNSENVVGEISFFIFSSPNALCVTASAPAAATPFPINFRLFISLSLPFCSFNFGFYPMKNYMTNTEKQPNFPVQESAFSFRVGENQVILHSDTKHFPEFLRKQFASDCRQTEIR